MLAVDTVHALLAFFDAINQHDADRLAKLITEDHTFTDSLGRSQRGRETMRAGWRGYFALCPDYHVSHEQMREFRRRVRVGWRDHLCRRTMAPRKQVANAGRLARHHP